MADLIKSGRTEDKCDQMVGIPSPGIAARSQSSRSKSSRAASLACLRRVSTLQPRCITAGLMQAGEHKGSAPPPPPPPPSVITSGGKPALKEPQGSGTLSGHSQLDARTCAGPFQTNCRCNDGGDDDDDEVDEDVSQEQPPAIRGQAREIWRITPTVDLIKEKGL